MAELNIFIILYGSGLEKPVPNMLTLQYGSAVFLYANTCI